MRVRVLRPLWYAGEMRMIGAELDLPDLMARESIFNGKVERIVPGQEKLPGPMSTTTAPELVGGGKKKGAT